MLSAEKSNCNYFRQKRLFNISRIEMRARNRYLLKWSELKQAQFDTPYAFCNIHGRSACAWCSNSLKTTTISGSLILPGKDLGK
jgi:hypothetical protein